MKKLFVWFVLLFTFSFMSVHAMESKIHASKTAVKPGDEVDVSIHLDSKKVAFTYDKNIFEAIDTDSFLVGKDVTVSAEDNHFYFSKKQDEDVEFTLKVRDDVVESHTTLLVTADGVTDKLGMEVSGKQITKFPSLWMIPGMLALVIALFMAYYYMKKKDHFENRELKVMIFSGILVLLSAITAVFLHNRIVTKPKVHPSEYMIEVKDSVNNDKTLEEKEEVVVTPTVENTVMTGSINKTTVNQKTNKILYRASIDDYLTDTDVVKRGDDVIITFHASIKPYSPISAVLINGVVYPVSVVEDKYQVVLKANESYGNHDYTITGVILENGEKIEVTSKNVTVYTLKVEPTVENIKISGREIVPVLTFDVKDPEDAFVSGTVVMTRNDQSKISLMALDDELLNADDVRVGKNTYAVPLLTENMGYDLVITLEYDLDDDKSDTEYADEKMVEQEEVFEREYNFELKNPTYPTVVDEKKELTLTFLNGDFSYTDVTEVVIDGETYSVTKDDNGVYSLDRPVTKCSGKGNCSFTIESVKIVKDDQTEKTIDVGEKLEYIYLKNAPSIDDFSATYDQENVTGTFTITDDDDAVTGGRFVIEGPENFKTEVSLTSEEVKAGTSASITKVVTLDKAGEYTVTLVVDYDLGDGKTASIEYESKDKITEEVKADITGVKKPDGKVTRGGTIDLYYTISSNVVASPKTVMMTINDSSIPATLQEDGTYKVTVIVPAEGDGLTRDIAVSKIVYADKDIELDYHTTIDILKKAPTIATFTLSQAGGQISGAFTLNDEEAAAIGAKYQIDGGEERVLSDSEFNAKTFTDETVRNAGDYSVTLTLIYDLGDGNEKSDVTTTEQVNVKKDATITDVTIDPMFVTKGATVTITYTVKDNTDSTLSKITINGTDYEVEDLGNDLYQVAIDIPDSETAGTKEYTATKLMYVDGEEFSLNEHAKMVTTTVLKTKPEFSNFTVQYESNQVTGSVTVNEPKGEETVTGGELVISGPCFSKPHEIPLTTTELKDTFTKDLALTKMGEYTVDLYITYNLGDQDVLTKVGSGTISKELESSIESVTAPEVVVKNGDIKLVYKINDNTDAKVSSITVNGEQKSVIYDADTDTYTVVINASDQAGQLTFHTSAITYADNVGSKDVSADSKTVYVLKDKPSVVEEPIYTDKVATVKIADNDKAKTTAQIVFTEVGTDQSHTLPVTFDGDSVVGTADITSLSNGIYHVKVEISYDLDGEELSLPQFTDTVSQEYENVSIITDYSSVAIATLKLNRFTEDHAKIVLDITTTNSTIAKVKEVQIGELWYTVDNGEDNQYTVTIDNPKERRELQITGIKLSTEFTKDIENGPKVIVNKIKPTAEVTTSEIADGPITATIQITDDDKTITGDRKAILKDADAGTEVESKDFTEDSTTVTFSKSLEGGKRYQVDVVASYDRVDGSTHSSEVIGHSSHIVVNPIVNVESFDVLSQYTYPGNKYFTITYRFKSNVKLGGDIKNFVIKVDQYDNSLPDKEQYVTVDGMDNLGEITLDTVRCDDSIKESDNANYTTTCRANYKIPNKSGVIKITPVSYTYLTDPKKEVGTEVSSQAKLVDITKPIPTVQYSTENDWDHKTVKVHVTVTGNSDMLEKFGDTNSYFKATLGTKQSSTVIDDLQGQKTIVFDNLNDYDLHKAYRISIQVYYNKYHGNIVNPNPQSEPVTVISSIHFITESMEASLNDLELVDYEGNDVTLNEKGESEFSLDEDVKLSFTLDGGDTYPDYHPTKIKVETSDTDNHNYPKEYEVTEKDGVYTTITPLTGLNEGTQQLKIVEMSNGLSGGIVKVTKDNVITVNILAPHLDEVEQVNAVSTVNVKEITPKPNLPVESFVQTDEEKGETDEDELPDEESEEDATLEDEKETEIQEEIPLDDSDLEMEEHETIS